MEIIIKIDDPVKESAKGNLEGVISYSKYARWFDNTNPYCGTNSELNLWFLLSQQRLANDLLKHRGHLFLNEVYDMLGFDRTQTGAVVGWIYNSKIGDNYVDFGIYNLGDRSKINKSKTSILLDFNVDGAILHCLREDWGPSGPFLFIFAGKTVPIMKE